MAMISYEQAWDDHCYLWEEYGPASDMTGGYVDQEDLNKLLRSPTKATARDCLCSQITYWFEVGVDSLSRAPDRGDEMLRDIAERHGIKW